VGVGAVELRQWLVQEQRGLYLPKVIWGNLVFELDKVVREDLGWWFA